MSYILPPMTQQGFKLSAIVEWTLISDHSNPYFSFVFIALQHMWHLKFCNLNQYTNVIGGATHLSVSIMSNCKLEKAFCIGKWFKYVIDGRWYHPLILFMWRGLVQKLALPILQWHYIKIRCIDTCSTCGEHNYVLCHGNLNR